MENDTISVIVPVYNVEQYVAECLDSLVNQTYKNLEIILVDDGSLDNSGKIIDEWVTKDPRIIALHKKNSGQGLSRNYGFDHSSGGYISFVDADDKVEKTYFEKLITTLKNTHADMSGCRFYRNNTDGEGYRYPIHDEKYRFTLSPEEFMERVYNDFGVFCMACGKLYKREVVVKDLFPGLRIAEDAMIIRELAYRCKRISYIPDALYMYRDRPGSTVTKKRSYSIEDQKERVRWLENDMTFYESKGNDRLRALAEKGYCYSIKNEWKFFDKECKDYYRPRYYKALKHMVVSEGNSLGAKCKYLAFGLSMLTR